LTTLNLYGTKITNLDELRELRNLRTLYLDFTPDYGYGLDATPGPQESDDTRCVWDSNHGRAGVKELGELKNLSRLNLK